ncbi:hypothetical protein [Sulfurimonas sp.]|uniref:hypothetical protein n=1 Tax=Sulfurimonas sp. TaxID=2022749 RepID=UPI0026266272|nr:hypothetical protein [Sulfurimonas sp.]
MKLREFNIKTENLELGYAQSDLNLEMIEEYFSDELDIPIEYINKLEILKDSLYVKLTDSVRYFNEDWYVNMQRIA